MWVGQAHSRKAQVISPIHIVQSNHMVTQQMLYPAWELWAQLHMLGEKRRKNPDATPLWEPTRMNYLSGWFVLERERAFICHLEVDLNNHGTGFVRPFSKVLLTLLPLTLMGLTAISFFVVERRW